MHFSEYCLTYHDVIRTEAARRIFRGQLELRICDPNLGELYLSGHLVRQGMVVRLDHPFLFRASRPNSISAQMSSRLDSFDELFQPGWMDQYDRILDDILSVERVEATAPEDRQHIHRSFRRFFAPLVIRALASDVGHARFKMSCSGPVRPFDPLPDPPDGTHARAAGKVLEFLRGFFEQ
jgi:hypothetical protein